MSAFKENYFRAFTYSRLSKEDGDKEESNSIANQRKMLRNYIEKQDDIVLVGEYYDDGYTGTNFERPNFTEMMDAIKQGEADCIIVKDLSRFGRDYIDAGKYIQKILPMLGVRFIAINDNVDSFHASQSDDLIIPFKNLMNDAYCRDLSIKLRGQFRVQRMKGEFLGAYACYGYLKSENDKHSLVIDENAAEIVRLIYARKLQGYSQQKIADYLNEIDVPSPAEYKKICGSNYKSGFQVNSKCIWTAMTVIRILKNKIYIGCLEQGKRSTPNYKVKKMLDKKPEDWIVVENNHEAIIQADVFYSIERSMERDTRVSSKGMVHPLSGMLYCGDCHSQMSSRSVKRAKRKFHYYVCGKYKYGGGCSGHSFPVEKLEKIILKSINLQMHVITDIKKLSTEIGEHQLKSYRIRKYDMLIEDKKREIESNQEYRLRLYESMIDGVITHDEYVKLRQRYTQKIEEQQEIRKQLEAEIKNIEAGLQKSVSWLDSFLKYKESTELTRDLVLTTINKINIYEDKRIEIIFNFQSELESLKEFVAQSLKEVV